MPLQVSEMALVRDVLYVCQGIDGKYIRYSPTAAGGLGGYALDPSTGLPAAQQQLLLQLCELGWLFRFAISHPQRACLQCKVTTAHSAVCSAFCCRS